MTVNTTATSPPVPDERFALPAQGWQLTRVADALAGRGFAVEILDDAGAARARIRDLLPEGSTVFTSASETLRLSDIEDDINTSGRYRVIKPLVTSMDRATRMDEIRALVATPQVETALRRIETYAYPREDRRARAVYGQPSAINETLIVNGEPSRGRTRVLLLRQAIGH